MNLAPKAALVSAIAALGFSSAAHAVTEIFTVTAENFSPAITPDPNIKFKLTFDPASTTGYSFTSTGITLLSNNLGLTDGSGTLTSQYNGSNLLGGELYVKGGSDTFVIDGASGTTPGFLAAIVNGSSTPTGTVSVGPVPEPATWALMTIGVAAIGARLRRRSGIVATA